jgi:NADH dehydrogenase.
VCLTIFILVVGLGVLGYVHIRKGLNKIGFIGILQPFRGATRIFK